MANQAPMIPQSEQDELNLLPRTSMDESLWSSLKSNVRAALFPEKLPPLQLTSRPVQVRDIWGEYNYKKQSAGVSVGGTHRDGRGTDCNFHHGRKSGQAGGEAKRDGDADCA